MGTTKQQERATAAAGQADAPSLARRLGTMAEIADTAAHEFNNLRSAIEGTLDLMTANPASPLTGQRLMRLRNTAARAEALSEGLVALARYRTGGEAAFDIGAWLPAARPWIERLVGSGIQVVLEVPSRPIRLRADPDRLRAVLSALLLNAAAALGPAGRIGVRIERNAGDRMFSLSVADNGPGMQPEVVVRAREPFFTTRPPAAGLGLALVESFANEQGGRLDLSSNPGTGTTASLHLPEADAASLP